MGEHGGESELFVVPVEPYAWVAFSGLTVAYLGVGKRGSVGLQKVYRISVKQKMGEI